MWESMVELMSALFFSALTLLVGSCIVVPMVAALRAVSVGSAGVGLRLASRKRASVFSTNWKTSSAER